MKRANFLKALVGMAVAPKIIAEIGVKPLVAANASRGVVTEFSTYGLSQVFQLRDIVMDSKGNRGLVTRISANGTPTIKNVLVDGPKIDKNDVVVMFPMAYQ